MNIKKVLNYIGSMLIIEAILMFLPFIVSIFYKEQSGKYYLIASIIILIFGLLLKRSKTDKRFFTAEGFITAALGWIIISILGSLPLYFSKEIPIFIDALFETVSGFTTTGATILDDSTLLSKTANFWRCLTHFVGGMGVLVLMLAIVPSQSEDMHIMKAESPGPQVGKLVPKVSDTAKNLYFIYITLTALTILSYKLSGMPFYDSICLGFSTAGTGGFTVTKNGCADYSYLSQILMIVFMFLFSINFNIYFLIALGKFKTAFKSEELKIFILIIVVVASLIVINTRDQYVSLFENIHNALFHTTSIITTTGFAIKDYTAWPLFSKYLLLLIMVFGGCAGSTAGGFKISRLIIIFKQAYNEIYLQLHPNSVRIVKFEDRIVPNETIRTVLSYSVIYLMMILGGTAIISLEKFDLQTTLSSVLEIFNNVGLGISKVGPLGNITIFSNLSKITFMILMLAGRLEIFPIIMLLSRKTWSRER